LENKIKPIWIFDGKPPELKMGELKKRADAKKDAKEQAEEAKDVGNLEQLQ
jgi:flap endonuclease-1